MKWLKRIFWIVNSVVILVVAAALWAAYAYRDQITPYAVDQLNKYLKTQVHVEGVTLSFLERFPQASIRFDSVYALGSNPKRTEDTLFRFEQVYLSFDLLDLYHGNYTLQHIDASDGFVRLHTDASGTRNFDILQSSEDTTDGRFQVNLQKITLKETDLQWREERSDRIVRLHVDKLVAKGSFSESEHETALYGSLLAQEVRLGEGTYLRSEPISLDVAWQANTETGKYRVSRGIFQLRNRYDLTITGERTPETYRLELEGTDLEWAALFSFLPASSLTLEGLEDARGNLDLSLLLEQNASGETPKYALDFSLRNGSWKLPTLDDELQEIRASGSFSNGKKRTLASSALRLDTVSARLGDALTLYGSGDLYNFDKLSVRASLAGSGDLQAWRTWIASDSLRELNGTFDYQLNAQGEIPTQDSSSWRDWLNLKKNVTVHVHQGMVQWNSWANPLSIDSASLEWDDVALVVNHATGTWGDIAYRTEGFTQTPLAELIDQGRPYDVQAELALSHFYWQPDTTEAIDPTPFGLPENLMANIDLKVDSFHYDRLRGKDLQASLVLKKGALNVPHYTFRALEGSMTGQASIRTEGQKFRFRTRSQARDINLSQTFETFREFGQTSIHHRNLEGRTAIQLDLSLLFDTNRNIDLASVIAQAEVQVANGELIEYEPLYSLIEDFRKNRILRLFIRLDDFEQRLHHVRFQTLTNTIRIENETVHIPKMTIRSSAMDLLVSGDQTFDNAIDYNLAFNLKDVLTRKNTQAEDDSYGYIADDGTGNKMVFLHITGTVDDPKVTFDRKASKAHNRQIAQQEVRTTKAVLNEELGLFGSEEHEALPPQNPAPELQMDFGEFDSTQVSSTPSDTGNTPETKPEQPTKKWKKLLNKVTGEDSQSKFEQWEFEDDDL